MTPEEVTKRIVKLAGEKKILEAAWTADLRACAPDDVEQQALDLSLHSFLIGAYHALGLYAMLLRRNVPDVVRQALLLQMQQEITKTTGSAPKMSIILDDFLAETVH